MRGGKRVGAGRKGYGETKVYRLPVALESEIFKLVEAYKLSHETNQVTPLVSECHETPMFPVLSKKQLTDFRQWLIGQKFAKGLIDARKQTESPLLCKKTFLKFIHTAEESSLYAISEIMEFYVVD